MRLLTASLYARKMSWPKPMSRDIISRMYTPNAPIVIVAGMEKTSHAIGKENRLLWHVPEDMKRFKQLTMGHPVIMGRKTFESITDILGKPLPGRTNIVITRNTTYSHPNANVKIAHSLDEALQLADAESPKEIHIGGGDAVYQQAMPYVSRLHLTLFDDPDVEADTFFPEYQNEFSISNEHSPNTHGDLTYQWVDLVRTRDAR